MYGIYVMVNGHWGRIHRTDTLEAAEAYMDQARLWNVPTPGIHAVREDNANA